AIRRRLQASAARGLTRFVGRQQALERAGAGHGQVAALVGEAGVGKSRLVYEFIHHAAGALGYAYAMTGRLAEACPLLEQALERARRIDRRNETRILRYLAAAYLYTGRQGDASAAAIQALDLSRTRSERGAEAWALRLLGDFHTQYESQNAEQAETHYRQALTLVEELGMHPLQAHCHRGLGTLHAKTSQQAQARTELSTAIVLYRAMDMTF